MARHESDREDLFAEATAFVRRAELALLGEGEPIVFGEKRTGDWSIYFGGDPVFHFDASGRLKRAFADGRLYRTQGDTLAELTRERTPDTTILRRRDLADAETSRFLAGMRARLTSLLAGIESENVRILRSEPVDLDALRELAMLLAATLGLGEERLLAPRLRGKR